MAFEVLSREEFQKLLKNIKISYDVLPNISSGNLSDLYKLFNHLKNKSIDELSFQNHIRNIQNSFPNKLSRYIKDEKTKKLLKKLQTTISSSPTDRSLDSLYNSIHESIKELKPPMDGKKIEIFLQRKLLLEISKIAQKNFCDGNRLPETPLTIVSIFDNPVEQEHLDVLNLTISLETIQRYKKMSSDMKHQVIEAKKAIHESIKQKRKAPDFPPDITEYLNLENITNQEIPYALMALLTLPRDEDDIARQQNFIKNSVTYLINEYAEHETPENQDFITHFTNGLYLSSRAEFPKCGFFTYSREKALKSAQDNYEKEIKSFISGIVPEDLNQGITYQELHDQFDPHKINSDFSASTLVLTSVPESIYLKVENLDETDLSHLSPKEIERLQRENDLKKELISLRKEKNKRLHFLFSVRNYINDNPIDEETYFQIYIQLLKEFQESTHPECYEERINPRDPNSLTCNAELKNTINNYKRKIENDSFLALATVDEMKDLFLLLEELNQRIDDKFQDKFLDYIMPKILSNSILQPRIEENQKEAEPNLDIEWEFMKDVKKPNGYCAKYYRITDKMTGLISELQVQTFMRYFDSKRGNSDHSKLKGRPNIKSFFELKNPLEDPAHLKKYLEILDIYTLEHIDKLKSQKNLTVSQKRLLKQVDYAINSIKIKDNMIFPREYPIYENGEEKYEDLNVPMEYFLSHYSEYISPKMSIIGSAHPLSGPMEANRTERTLPDRFAEMLKKQNDLTILSQMLVDRLSDLVDETQHSKTYSERSIRKYAKNRIPPDDAR